MLEDKGKGKEDERAKMVDEVKKLKDEQALLSEKAKAEKQGAIDTKIKALQDYDTKTRNEHLHASIVADLERLHFEE